MTRSFVQLAVVWCALFGSPAVAQRNSVVGTVRDSTGVPLPGAEITAGPVVARSDSLGRFYVAYPPADSVTLVVRRMGYERVTFTISSAAAAENSVQVTMHALATRLATVEVDAANIRARTAMEGFDRRRRHGGGIFLTKDDIAKRNTEDLSNVLRDQRGIVIQHGRNGRAQLRFVSWMAKGCLPQFWVDGRRVVGFEIDEIPASDVEGIELYDGPSSTPGEFMRAPDLACGTVVIWTKFPILNAP